ncbi:hypothetical protein [Streptomyces sp. NBC_00154]|uniref:hypothetical protein n=1 Tax=Streptomyces sp. NBC_00154 TaxID=2975670 RepID=UPI00225266CA|nr:hypothetical protein [Streptomyces sp. NBC_00154]MCX5312620.1 hypothetical protein [Streptomyces sp. NBC_00154]
MHLKRTLLVTVAACAAVAGPAFTGTAAAASNVTATSVSTSWGYAKVQAGWQVNPYKLDPLYMYVEDRDADGHSVAVRLVTYGDAGTHYFPLHQVSTGVGTHWDAFSYANPGGWIALARIELCQMEGSKILTCVGSSNMKPPFDDSSV